MKKLLALLLLAPLLALGQTNTYNLLDKTGYQASSVVITGGSINGASTGATTPSTGAFTTLSASGTVSGVGFTSLLTPYALLSGATFTGLIVPSYPAGIVGNATGNPVTAGSSGEYVCAQVTNGGTPTGCATNSNAPVPLSNGVGANVTSISLTAGDWDICGNIYENPAGTTITSVLAGGVSLVSATVPAAPGSGGTADLSTVATAGTPNGISTGCTRQIFSTTTTVFLVAFSDFTISTNAAYGFLGAHRR